MTDSTIISSILSGDSRGYSVLLKRYRSRLFFFINGMVFDRMDAEDLLMITFEKAFRKLNTWNGACKFSTWLYTIAKNTVKDFIISRAKRINEFADVDNYKWIADKVYNPEEKLLHSENVIMIEGCIDRLPRKRRQIIYLHADGNKDEDIARMLNMGHIAVRTSLHRTRNQLKSLLYEENNSFINCLIA